VRDTSVPESKRNFGLDALQALAILMVLCSKITFFMPLKAGLVSSLLPLFGFLGIELFLVLAGYWLGVFLYRESVFTRSYSLEMVWRFLKEKAIRFLPSYYMVLLVVLGISEYIGYSSGSVWSYFFFLQNFAKPMTPLFMESWPLCVVVFAFLLLPLAHWMAYKLVAPNKRRLVYFVVVLVLILAFIGTKVVYYVSHSVLTLEQWNIGLKAMVVYRLDSVFIGVLFGGLSLSCGKSWKLVKYVGLGMAVLLLIFLFVGIGYLRLTIDSYPFLWEVVYLPLTSLALGLLLPFFSQWKTKMRMVQVSLAYLSKSSFAVYLIHYSVVLQLYFYFWTIPSLSSLLKLCIYLSYVGTTLLLGSFFTTFFSRVLCKYRTDN